MPDRQAPGRMEGDRARNPADIFGDALEQPPDTRSEFLRIACAGAPDLLREVESLLRAHAQLEIEGWGFGRCVDRDSRG